MLAAPQDLAFQVPTAWNWNLTFERELPWSTKVEVGYVGVLGKKYPMHRRYNLPDRLTGERLHLLVGG